MSLLNSDVLNARKVLSELNIKPNNISCGWHNGNISLIITCLSNQKDKVLEILEEETSICIPIIIEEDFSPQWEKVL